MGVDEIRGGGDLGGTSDLHASIRTVLRPVREGRARGRVRKGRALPSHVRRGRPKSARPARDENAVAVSHFGGWKNPMSPGHTGSGFDFRRMGGKEGQRGVTESKG